MRTLFFGFGLLSFLMAKPQAGGLDPTFGDTGILLLQPDELYNDGRALTALADNTLLVAGNSGVGNTSAFVTHVHQDGSLDTAFGDGGYRYIAAGSSTWVQALAVMPDGSILLTGSLLSDETGTDILLAKLTPTGDMDLAFGSDGIVQTAVTNLNESGTGLALQSDGRIVVVGSMVDPNGSDNSVLLRYNADGTLDTGFSGDGILVLTNWIFDDELVDAVVFADGSLIAVGSTAVDGEYRSLLIKVTSDGELDDGFGMGGQLLPFDGFANDWASGVVLDNNGFFVGGYLDVVPGQRDGYVARFQDNGMIDSAFNGAGMATLHINDYDAFLDIALQANGQVVLCGTTGVFSSEPHDILVARFQADGSQDSDFGANGYVTTDIQPQLEVANAVDIQPNGRIVVCGFASGSPSQAVVARYLPDICAVFPGVSPETVILCPNGTSELITGTFDTYQWYKNGAEIPGATGQTVAVNSIDDLGSWFKVRTTIDTCFGFSDSVLVDGYVFLPPVIINEGDQPNLIGDNGEQVYCQGDDPVLVLGAPYDSNVQWSVNGEPIADANDTLYAVTGSGNYTVEGAPAVCPNFIQDAGITVVMDFHPYVQPTIYQTGILLCPQPEGLSSQWYYNGQPVADFEGCVIPIDAGNYTVFVDYGDSCSVLSAPFYVVGLDEYARMDMKVSPVPTSDQVAITWAGGGPIMDWRVIDVTGRIVRSGMSATSPLTIDLGTVDVGRYRFLSGDGRSLALVVAH